MEKIKKLLIIFIALSVLCAMCNRAHAASYSVYSDCTLDTYVTDVQSLSFPATVSLTDEDIDSVDEITSSDVVVLSSYANYDSGLPSSTYVEIARGLVRDVPFGQDYVFARTGQYQYLFAYGDFSDGFYGSAVTYLLNTSNGYNGSSTTFYSFTDSDFSLSVGDSLVYSSLPYYPSLLSNDFSYAILFVLVLSFVTVFMFFVAYQCFRTLRW